ncbi:2-methylcitrate dehydratase PrpD [Pseudonocardia hierapolitana]|uniref:2-methylcitrate dehydratase PrpD n=1 Tax=Pseudonocardia hierapolitana TaxID=1128676 RepID=A0A561SJG5_9PSEU|nr:MmgE/PrpD family protein [Pseudonocardia hierapolitana]TWF74973.1 2-methylcitrate dehydratase PrpD [Pseudonocardia hierapolitana]
MNAPTALDDLAGRAAGLAYSDLAEPTVRQVELLVTDLVGAAIAGARRCELTRYADKAASTRQARMLVSGDRWGEAGVAAFVNGCACVALELDDGLVGGGHAGAHVIPAALAAAQREHRCGAELIAAVVAGYEVAARLFRAYRLRYPAHPHGHLGAVGGAVAVARLTGTSPSAAARVASTLPILSTWSACFEGVSARNAVVGLANLVAITAADLADAGFVGATGALEEAFGQIAGEPRDADALGGDVDPARLAVHDAVTKHLSVAGPLHCAVEAARQVARPGRIIEVRVETVAGNVKFAGQPRPNSLSSRFSLPYAVAAALCKDPARVRSFDHDPEVAALAARVRVVAAPDLEEHHPGTHAARVTVVGPDGEDTALVTEPKGGPARPATEAELAAKFAALVPGAAPVHERLTSLRDVEDCATLIDGAL